MKKTIDPEEERNDSSRRLQQKIDHQVTKVEEIIDNVLGSVDMSKLTSRERLMIGAHFINIHQRLIGMRHVLDQSIVDNSGNLALIEMAARMRGDWEDEDEFRVADEEEDCRVVDADIPVYPENDDSLYDD